MGFQTLMIVDIFSTFDPSNHSTNLISSTLFWSLCLAPIFIIFSSIWGSSPNYQWLFSSLFSIISSQTKRTTGYHLKGFSSILSSLFLTIIFVNFLGLIPSLFRVSPHLLFTLSFGLPLWFTFIISAIACNPKSMAANLLPGGAPRWLNPALIIIETTSILIRPITLCFRLAANMTAGHIVLSLIGIYASIYIFSSCPSFFLIFFIETRYSIFEFGICLIQAYIFCLLLSLYSNDHP